MRILEFEGEVPKFKPQMLSLKNAALAVNVDLYGGILRPHRNPAYTARVVDERGRPYSRTEPLKAIIPVGSYMVGFPDDVSWVNDTRSNADNGTVLFVRGGKLWRLSPSMLRRNAPAKQVGIDKPQDPPTVAKAEGAGCLEIWDAHACSVRNLKCGLQDTPDLRAYRITYVTDCGEESDASLPSEVIDVYNGDGVLVTDPNTPPPNAVKRRIYRSAATTDGDVMWLFIGEDIISDNVFIDDVCPDGLGEPLPYENVFMPSCIDGIALTRNLQTVVWAANEFWVSEPFSPHAYRTDTRVTLPYRIQFISHYTHAVEGEAHFGNFIGTEGYPYAVEIRDDGQAKVKEIERWYPALTPYGFTAAHGFTYYVSSAGIVAADGHKADLLTDDLMTEREWATFKPRSVRLTATDQRLFAWFDTATQSTRAGLLFNLPIYDKRRPFTMSRISLNVKMSVAAVDKPHLLLIGTDTYAWGEGAGYMPYTWRSKVEVSAARWFPAVVKIVGDSVVPYTRRAYTARKRFELWAKQHTNINADVYFDTYPEDRQYYRQIMRQGADVVVTLYADGEKYYSRPVMWAEPVPIRAGRRAIEWQIEVSGTTELREIHLQKSRDDLQNDGGHA